MPTEFLLSVLVSLIGMVFNRPNLPTNLPVEISRQLSFIEQKTTQSIEKTSGKYVNLET